MRNCATYYHVKKAKKRIVVNQGGSRSGKTYSICQVIIERCVAKKGQGYIISICRKTGPALKATVYRDFFELLLSIGMYDEADHNKTEQTYNLFGNLIEFFSLDEPKKVRGRKRDVLFINEANEIDFESWRQLLLRTTQQVIIDFNPSEEFHWIYDEVLTRDDCEFYQTSYKDNPFLEPELVAEIERLQKTDEDYWNVYGLGNRGSSKDLVFKNWGEVNTIPEGAKLVSYGMDFGFTADPTTLIGTWLYDGSLYIKELIYQKGLHNSDISNMLQALGIDKRAEIYCDSSEPKTIDELYRFGWNCKPTAKGPDSITAGIDMIRRYPLKITSDSINLIKELRNYKYAKDKNERVTNYPIDAFNHCCDALRYSTFNSLNNPNKGKYNLM